MSQLFYSHDTATALQHYCEALQPDRIFVLSDHTTHSLCKPLLNDCAVIRSAHEIIIGGTDVNKTLQTLAQVWEQLSNHHATRRSLLINLGGGMVTDLGGFAAATFKRGIRFINIPTTLLSMVDAAVGGKTGINFNGFKNEVGSFCDAEAVFIDTRFLQTLDTENLYSGYAEMLKHALIERHDMWADHLKFSLSDPDWQLLQQLVEQSITTKQRIVQEDPHEHGIRKALNLGHTVGHAFESFALERHQPMLHGYAVALGLVCELYLSVISQAFPMTEMRQTVRFIRKHYAGKFAFTCKDYEHLYELMKHDKKNSGGQINFTLLGGIGDIRLNCHVTPEDIFESFDFLREG